MQNFKLESNYLSGRYHRKGNKILTHSPILGKERIASLAPQSNTILILGQYNMPVSAK